MNRLLSLAAAAALASSPVLARPAAPKKGAACTLFTRAQAHSQRMAARIVTYARQHPWCGKAIQIAANSGTAQFCSQLLSAAVRASGNEGLDGVAEIACETVSHLAHNLEGMGAVREHEHANRKVPVRSLKKGLQAKAHDPSKRSADVHAVAKRSHYPVTTKPNKKNQKKHQPVRGTGEDAASLGN